VRLVVKEVLVGDGTIVNEPLHSHPIRTAARR
jgi:hypothetical protein